MTIIICICSLHSVYGKYYCTIIIGLELCISPDAASQVLKKYEEEFFEVVDPKHNLLRLKRKNVITESLTSKIESADRKDAQEILFEHMHHNADVATLTEYCKMAIAADAFPKMQKLGEKMLNELALEGLLGQCGDPYAVCVFGVCAFVQG